MDYYAVAGMVALILISFATFYYAVKKNISEQMDKQSKARDESMEATNELTKAIMELNINFKHMREQDEVRDRRITTHGNEINALREQQRKNEKILDLHNYRIGNLEDAVGKPFKYGREREEDD